MGVFEGLKAGMQLSQQQQRLDLDRQQKQEILKLQKQKFKQQLAINAQAMQKADFELQQLKEVQKAQKRLNAKYERDLVDGALAMAFEAGDRKTLDKALERINQFSGMKGQKVRSLDVSNEEDINIALEYVRHKGYSAKSYIAETDEEGKTSYRKPNELDPVEMNEAYLNAKQTDIEMAKGLIESAQLTKNNDNKAVGLDDVAMITAHYDRYPSSQQKNDEIMLGLRANQADMMSRRERKPTSIEEKERILEKSLKLQGITEGTLEYDKAYAQGITEISLGSRASLKEVRDTRDVGDVIYSRQQWEDYKKGSDIDEKAMLQAELSSGIRKDTRYKNKMEEVDENKKTLALVNDVNKDLASMSPSEAKKEASLLRGPVENLAKWGASFFSYDEVGQIWDDEAVERLKNTFPMNTKLGMLIQQYVKSISGATVTDAEREFFMETLTGGNLSDPDVLRTTLSTFQEVVSQRQQLDADALGEMGAGDSARLTMESIPEPITVEKKTSTIPEDFKGLPSRTIGNETRYWKDGKWVQP